MLHFFAGLPSLNSLSSHEDEGRGRLQMTQPMSNPVNRTHPHPQRQIKLHTVASKTERRGGWREFFFEPDPHSNDQQEQQAAAAAAVNASTTPAPRCGPNTNGSGGGGARPIDIGLCGTRRCQYPVETATAAARAGCGRRGRRGSANRRGACTPRQGQYTGPSSHQQSNGHGDQRSELDLTLEECFTNQTYR